MHPFTRAAAVTVLASLAFAGCDKDASSARPKGPAQPADAAPAATDVESLKSDPAVNQWLLDVCKKHGLPAQLRGDWVGFDGSPVRLSAAMLPDDAQRADIAVVQVEFRAQLPGGRTVVQPVVGWGADRDAAVASAEASFLLGSFHALLGAFIDPDEQHVRTERRPLNGRERVITFGDVVTKVLGDQQLPKEDGWREQLMKELDASNLPPGTHWVDVYNAKVDKKQELEIQLDSRRWTDMEAKMRGAAWPDSGSFTSVRLFLIVQDPDDATRPAPKKPGGEKDVDKESGGPAA